METKQGDWETELLDWGDGLPIRVSHRKYSLSMFATLIASAGTETNAARDILTERRRQIEAEGWAPEHDDEHGAGEMALAAACYALNAAGCGCEVARNWPWDRSWWKPSTPRRDLVKAGALILAEIERLDRAADDHQHP